MHFFHCLEKDERIEEGMECRASKIYLPHGIGRASKKNDEGKKSGREMLQWLLQKKAVRRARRMATKATFMLLAAQRM